MKFCLRFFSGLCLLLGSFGLLGLTANAADFRILDYNTSQLTPHESSGFERNFDFFVSDPAGHSEQLLCGIFGRRDSGGFNGVVSARFAGTDMISIGQSSNRTDAGSDSEYWVALNPPIGTSTLELIFGSSSYLPSVFCQTMTDVGFTSSFHWTEINIPCCGNSSSTVNVLYKPHATSSLLLFNLYHGRQAAGVVAPANAASLYSYYWSTTAYRYGFYATTTALATTTYAFQSFSYSGTSKYFDILEYGVGSTTASTTSTTTQGWLSSFCAAPCNALICNPLTFQFTGCAICAGKTILCWLIEPKESVSDHFNEELTKIEGKFPFALWFDIASSTKEVFSTSTATTSGVFQLPMYGKNGSTTPHYYMITALSSSSMPAAIGSSNATMFRNTLKYLFWVLGTIYIIFRLI